MLKRGIMTIFRANIIALFFNLLTSFLLPKYLSMETYGQIKTYQLYISYIGLLHFGFSDGTYLKYGGRTLNEINEDELVTDIVTMQKLQLAISVLTIFICVATRNFVWIAFSLSVLPLNMISYYKSFFQATGEFEKFGKITNRTTIATFAVNLLILFLFRERENYIYFVFTYVFLDFVIWIIIEFRIFSKMKLCYNMSLFSMNLFSNIKNGIFLMFGNLSTTLFTGVDRWFVKYLMDITAFAQYSFAVSIENFMNVAITPVSVTFYNYFCKKKNLESLKETQGLVVLFAVTLPVCAFPAKWILERFLYQYINSSSVLFYLFSAQIFAIIIKCIYINLYKAYHKQKLYFVKLILILIISIFLNAVCFLIKGNKEAFAIGTLISNVLWFLFSIVDFPEIMPNYRILVYLMIETALFLYTGNNYTAIVGCLIYVLLTILFTFFLMQKEMKTSFIVLKSVFTKS